MIVTKRVYESPSKDDGLRILVDRIWPRGLSKGRASIDTWVKNLSPSSELRRWFRHDPARWDEFRRRYYQELDDNIPAIKELLNQIGNRRATLLFGARDTERNNAVALKDYLEKYLDKQQK